MYTIIYSESNKSRMNINFQINSCLFRWETHEIRKSILSQFKLEICVQNTVWFDCSHLYMFVISDGAEKLPMMFCDFFLLCNEYSCENQTHALWILIITIH